MHGRTGWSFGNSIRRKNENFNFSIKELHMRMHTSVAIRREIFAGQLYVPSLPGAEVFFASRGRSDIIYIRVPIFLSLSFLCKPDTRRPRTWALCMHICMSTSDRRVGVINSPRTSHSLSAAGWMRSPRRPLVGRSSANRGWAGGCDRCGKS